MHATTVRILILLFVAKVNCDSDLKCYVCDDCPKVTDRTPLLPCNENSFNENPKMMTTTMSSTTTGATETTTTTIGTSATVLPFNDSSTEGAKDSTPITTPMTTTTTEQMLRTQELSNDTTTESIPQPPTVGPLSSTTLIPTPPTEGTLVPSLNESLIEDNAFNKSYLPTSTFRGQRQRRQLAEDAVTYHCFTIEKKYPGKNRIQRGCSFVHTNEAVCTQLKAVNNYTINKCEPCSKSQCNGSATMKISIIVFALAGFVALFKN